MKKITQINRTQKEQEKVESSIFTIYEQKAK